LQETLSSEVEDYRQLLLLTQREQVALQKGNLVDLMATIPDKASLLQRLAEGEKSRQKTVVTLAEKLKLPADASLADLITFCDEAAGQNLSALRHEFMGLAEQLSHLNQGNQLLLQSELARVNATVNYFLSHMIAGAGYTVSGMTTPSSLSQVTGNVLNWQI
jgi:flagellar biosynthesis/type III secretory pathway chaperone